MPVQVQCPNPVCGKTGRVPDIMVNQPGRCSACGTRFTMAVSTEPDALKETVFVNRGSASNATLNNPPRQTQVPPIQSGDVQTKSSSCPTHIGRFIIHERAGAGAFGAVYRAYDPQLDREVALKVPQEGILDSPKRVERFLREARAAAQLRHPHIVPVYEAGCDGSQYYIASAFISGTTLARYLEKEKRLDFQTAARIVRDLAEALAYAHGQGIVHRDLKPANVMIDGHGQPHLMDFGLAARQDALEKLTHDGAILGTPAYMAPEQAAGHKGEARPASDQYGLGVLLFELLCGQTPFSGPPPVILFNVLNTQPPSPRSLRPYLPRDLETICLKAMAKELEQRYESCDELANDLRRFLEGEPVKARRMSWPERVVRWCKREPKTAVAVLTVLLCLTITAVVASIGAVRLGEMAQREGNARAEAENKRELAEKAQQEAENQRLEAENERKNAESRRKEAEEAKSQLQKTLSDLEGQRNKTSEALTKADDQRRRAEETLEALKKENSRVAQLQKNTRSSDYMRLLDTASAHIQKDQWDQADQALAACPEKLRGWEWNYLRLWAKSRKQPREERTVTRPPGYAFRRISPSMQEALFSVTQPTYGTTIQIVHTIGGGATTLPPALDQVGPFAFGRDYQVAFLTNSTSGETVTNSHIKVFDKIGSPFATKELFDKRVNDIAPKYSTGGKTTKQPFACLALNWDRKHKPLAIGYGGGSIQIWDVDSGKLDVTFSFDKRESYSSPYVLAFMPGGNYLACLFANGMVAIWHVPTGDKLTLLKADPQHFSHRLDNLAFSPDGRFLAIVQHDRANARSGLIQILDPTTGELKSEVRTEARNKSMSMVWSPDGQRVITATDKEVKVWDVESGLDLITLERMSGGSIFTEIGFSNLITDGKQKLEAFVEKDNKIVSWLTEAK
ncbi:MAG: protein kinase domain-containing protein [Gemmataceae bacterium]